MALLPAAWTIRGIFSRSNELESLPVIACLSLHDPLHTVACKRPTINYANLFVSLHLAELFLMPVWLRHCRLRMPNLLGGSF